MILLVVSCVLFCFILLPFPLSSVGLWLRYVRIVPELMSAVPAHGIGTLPSIPSSSQLYWRALKTLDDDLNGQFVAEFRAFEQQ